MAKRTGVKELQEYFGNYGKVTHAEVKRDSTGKYFGSVVFAGTYTRSRSFSAPGPAAAHHLWQNAEHVDSASSAPGKPNALSREEHVGTSSSVTRNSDARYNPKKLFVRKLNSSVTEVDFHSYFNSFGTVTHSNIVWKGEVRQNYGIIAFDSEAAVNRVLDQEDSHEINLQTVEVYRYYPKCRPSSLQGQIATISSHTPNPNPNPNLNPTHHHREPNSANEGGPNDSNTFDSEAAVNRVLDQKGKHEINSNTVVVYPSYRSKDRPSSSQAQIATSSSCAPNPNPTHHHREPNSGNEGGPNDNSPVANANLTSHAGVPTRYVPYTSFPGPVVGPIRSYLPYPNSAVVYGPAQGAPIYTPYPNSAVVYGPAQGATMYVPYPSYRGQIYVNGAPNPNCAVFLPMVPSQTPPPGYVPVFVPMVPSQTPPGYGPYAGDNSDAASS